MDIKEAAKVMKEIMGLTHEPIAVKFLEKKTSLDGFEIPKMVQNAAESVSLWEMLPGRLIMAIGRPIALYTYQCRLAQPGEKVVCHAYRDANQAWHLWQYPGTRASH